jgi:hypothetical protein
LWGELLLLAVALHKIKINISFTQWQKMKPLRSRVHPRSAWPKEMVESVDGVTVGLPQYEDFHKWSIYFLHPNIEGEQLSTLFPVLLNHS